MSLQKFSGSIEDRTAASGHRQTKAMEREIELQLLNGKIAAAAILMYGLLQNVVEVPFHLFRPAARKSGASRCHTDEIGILCFSSSARPWRSSF